jgi:hypothetical protein
MRPAFRPSRSGLPLLIAAAALLGAAAPLFAKAAWKPLFNGKSFRPDWRYVGDSTFWTIDPVDTSIVGYSPTTKTPHALLFSSKADYDQFTVKYSYRLKAGCSGFWFRSKGTTADNVTGPQVEIKREGNELLEIGSIYTWPTPGWEVQHNRAFSIKAAPKVDDYQHVVLTVKSPNVYVNVNGHQAIGETDAALIAAGAKAAWNYTNSTHVKSPRAFALQVHKDYAIDVRFKDIAILEGCGNPASPNYDGASVAGLAKQPAVYQDNGSCAGTAVSPAESRDALLKSLGNPLRRDGATHVEVSHDGPHALEVFSPEGRSLFSGSSPRAQAYRLSASLRGLVFVRLSAEGQAVTRRLVLP